ncbi:MAG: N-acetyl-gamma-glutamyl-phosphate reductase [Selenomonadaceae bacterium]|nr:N-acetyl-gamma-glutamyl-phosphate reductase [Selenomonadaceae bacterium]
MKISVIGATGYAGAELLRLLYGHPEAKLVHITSESHKGEKIASLYPNLRGLCDLTLESMQDMEKIGADSDFVFIALPHGHAMEVGKGLAHLPVRIIDLGADYRFKDTAVYEAWYHVPHTHKEAERVYGLAELYREDIRRAKIIGNAGCFTTASILALAPLAKEKLVDMQSIVIDAKSGVSGAGRSPKQGNHFPELYDNFKAYNVAHHRHTPEIEQALTDLSGETTVLNFTPHLVPMSRGILATSYAHLREGVTAEEVGAAFHSLYDNEYFIRLLGEGGYPSTKEVRGSNFTDLAWHIDDRTHRVIVLSAIDNLVKGAAGQAIQNFNIACGFDEKTGLDFVPMYP